jgi:hypothetical protein
MEEALMALFRSLPPALAGLVLCVTLAGQSLVIQPAQAERVTETRTLPLSAGAVLKVSNTNGFIHVEGWDREEVQFTGEFKPSSRNEQVKVVIEAQTGALEIRGEGPKPTAGDAYRSPVCRMTLRVPRRISPTLDVVNGEITLKDTLGPAVLSSVNGAIHAENLADAVKASTVNGAIYLDQVKGGLTLRTVNGAIHATGLDGQGKGIKAETVNGGIRLQMEGVKGHLKASAQNGGITFSARGAEQVERKQQRLSAVLPGSDQAIELATVNGAIHLD